MSFQFANRFRRDMIVRDIRNGYPETQEVFERFAVRAPCWDCSLVEVSHRCGIRVEELVSSLEEVVAAQTLAERQRQDES